MKQSSDLVITCDMGKNTSIAYWDAFTGKLLCIKALRFSDLDVVKIPQYALDTMNKINSYFKKRKHSDAQIKLIILEGVSVWGNSARSTVANKTQSLTKLAYYVGGVAALCKVGGIPVKIQNAQEWKGQLSKEATRLRVLRVYPELNTHSEHSIDAVGIGLNYFGKL